MAAPGEPGLNGHGLPGRECGLVCPSMGPRSVAGAEVGRLR
jgi:hypothetical protein